MSHPDAGTVDPPPVPRITRGPGAAAMLRAYAYTVWLGPMPPPEPGFDPEGGRIIAHVRDLVAHAQANGLPPITAVHLPPEDAVNAWRWIDLAETVLRGPASTSAAAAPPTAGCAPRAFYGARIHADPQMPPGQIEARSSGATTRYTLDLRTWREER